MKNKNKALKRFVIASTIPLLTVFASVSYAETYQVQIGREIVKEAKILEDKKEENLTTENFSFSQISCGGYSCLIIKDNDVWASGYNAYYNYTNIIARNGTTNKFTKTNLNNAKKVISTMIGSSLALDKDGNVWAVGRNFYGSLGAGSINELLNWTKTLSNIKDISTMYYHALALDNDGNVWSTGINSYNNLQNQNLKEQYIYYWKKTKWSNIKQIAAGQEFSLVLDNEGKVWMTGRNNFGQLGLGYESTDLSQNFEPVNTISNIKEIFAGQYSAFAIDNNGELWAVGNNSVGQLGVGDKINKSIWTKTSLKNIKTVKAGMYHSMAITTNNELYTTGQNSYGMLGLENYVNVTQVEWKKANIENVLYVNGNHYNTEIIDKDGRVFIVGINYDGQFGLGTSTSVNTWTEITNDMFK